MLRVLKTFNQVSHEFLSFSSVTGSSPAISQGHVAETSYVPVHF